jgi:sphingomyelin phosphodiesterase acid-like 3
VRLSVRGIRFIVTVGIAGLLATGSRAQAQTAPATVAADGDIVLLSDIHFNPLPPGCPAAEAMQAVAILQRKEAKKWSGKEFRLQGPPSNLGRDTNYPLLTSALHAAHAAAPNAKLVIVPGDFVVHTFPEHFKACRPDSTPADFTAFIARTIEFVGLEISRTFPNAQILPVLGNNDSDQGDYTLPSPEMRKHVAAAWLKLATNKHKASDADFSGFAVGGYYQAKIEGWPHLRVAGLNSIAWSARFRDGGKPDISVGDGQLDWLQGVLTSAESAGDKVVVVGHVPPGLDAWATRNSGGKQLVTMYEECGEQGASASCRDFGHAVPNLLQRFSTVIALGVFGHTHQEEFRLVGNSKSAVATKVVPSISPVLGNNPAFLVVSADDSFAWRDYTAWILPLSEAAKTPAEWRAEYSFDAAYGQPEWNATALHNLVEKLNNEPAVRKEFFLRMGSGSTQVQVPTRWQEAYICGLSHMTPEGVIPCIATAQTGIPFP